MTHQKPCRFCIEKRDWIDHKEERVLRRYMSDRGKIVPRRQSGVCAKHQRMLTTAIKRARHVALLPFTTESVR